MHHISPEELALYGMFSTSIMLMSTLLSMGLRQTFMLEYYHHSIEQRLLLLKNLIAIYVIVSLPLSILAFSMTGFLPSEIPHNLFYLALAIAWLSFFSELFYQWLIYTKQTNFLVGSQLFGAFVAGISIIVLYNLRLLNGCTACISVSLVTTTPALISLMYFYYLLLDTSASVSLPLLLTYVKIGAPFIPTIFANWCILSSQRFIIAHKCSLHDAGLYSIIDIMHQVCALLLLQTFATLVLPEIFERFNNSASLVEENKRILNVMQYTMTGLLVAGLLLYLPAYYCVQRIIPAIYLPVLPLTLIAYIGNVFLLGTYFLQCLVQFKKMTLFLSISLCVSGIVSLLLSKILIPLYGLQGAVWATTLAYVFYFLMSLKYNSIALKSI